MKPLACVCFFCIFTSGLAWAQETGTEVSTGPKPGLVFPIQEKEGKVFITENILINKNKVLPAGTFLYTIYNMPSSADEDVKQAQKKLDRDKAYAREKRLDTESKSNAAQEALKRRALETTWNNHLIFRAMVNRMLLEEMFIVYQNAQGEKKVDAIDFPDGLMLVSSAKGVVVRWLDPNKSAAKYGFKVGDRLVTISANPVKTLEDFQHYYFSTKSVDPNARESMAVQVTAEGETEPRTVLLKAPLTLSGSALDLF